MQIKVGAFQKIIEKILPKIENHTLSPASRVMAFLYYAGQSIFMSAVGDFLGMHKTSVHKSVRDVARALAELAPEVLKFPDEEVAVLCGSMRNEYFRLAFAARGCSTIAPA